MRSSTSSFRACAIAAVLALTACSNDGTDDASGANAPGTGPERSDGDGDGGIKAPPVGGPAVSDDLTEKLGVFVTPSGSDNGDGTRARPLARIQPAIELGKKLGKRVYVCTGEYREALVVADSISVIGGLDCSSSIWRTGAPRTRVVSPTSPALLARDIVTATRLESLDVVAPAATKPGESSIALLASGSGALVVASSRLAAGDAMKGEDGTDGIQLVQAATADGKPSVGAKDCVNSFSCQNNDAYKPPATVAGTNVCQGAAGIAGGAGGYGGSGGAWEVYQPPPVGGVPRPLGYRVWLSNFALDAEAGLKTPSSAPGADGAHGQNGALVGMLSRDGYVPANGTNGADGAPGAGGAGGSGLKPQGVPAAGSTGAKWMGNTGASGGAGGCPGLAGTAGKGGGASIAALLFDSASTFDASELVSGRGGDAGLGTFGSAPTPGGQAGTNNAGVTETAAQAGGRGGAAGPSGNGGAGPSIALAHAGVAPKLLSATKLLPGTGGAAVDERTRTDALGLVSTIPATPAGVSKDLLPL